MEFKSVLEELQEIYDILDQIQKEVVVFFSFLYIIDFKFYDSII